MKKEYIKPEVEVIKLWQDFIILSSSENEYDLTLPGGEGSDPSEGRALDGLFDFDEDSSGFEQDIWED